MLLSLTCGSLVRILLIRSPLCLGVFEGRMLQEMLKYAGVLAGSWVVRGGESAIMSIHDGPTGKALIAELIRLLQARGRGG